MLPSENVYMCLGGVLACASPTRVSESGLNGHISKISSIVTNAARDENLCDMSIHLLYANGHDSKNDRIESKTEIPL